MLLIYKLKFKIIVNKLEHNYTFDYAYDIIIVFY